MGHGPGGMSVRHEPTASAVSCTSFSTVSAEITGPLARVRSRFSHPWRVVITVGGLLLLANLVVYLLVTTNTNPVGTENLPSAVEQLLPDRGALIRPQEDVGVDLADDYTGVLLVDGVEIPEDQLQRVVPLGQVSFRPGVGKQFERWTPGDHTAVVVYWLQTETREHSSSRYSWRFKVG